MAIIFKDSTLSLAYNDRITRTGRINRLSFVAARVPLGAAFRDLFVGGYAEDMVIFQDGELLSRRTYFQGEIDAIRFSNIARYDLPAERETKPFEPPHRFVSDEHTLALWDFNEKADVTRFEDASGHGKTLIGMNGATVIGGKGIGNLEIRPDKSLVMTWGQIKSGTF